MVNYNIAYNKAIYKYFLKIFYNKTYKKVQFANLII